jgi:hypothetical protein
MVDAETKLSDRIFMILAGEYCADGVLSTVMIVMHGNVIEERTCEQIYIGIYYILHTDEEGM